MFQKKWISPSLERNIYKTIFEHCLKMAICLHDITLAYFTKLNKTTVAILFNFFAGSLPETSNFVQVFAIYLSLSTKCCSLLKRSRQRFYSTTTSFTGLKLLSINKHILNRTRGSLPFFGYINLLLKKCTA